MTTADDKPVALDERLRRVAPGADGADEASRDLGLPSFHFQFAGLPFQAEVVPGASPLVRLKADLGPLPYTIEAPQQRHWMLRIVAASKRLKRGTLAIGEDGMVRLSAETAPASEGGPVAVLAAVTALLLDFKPHLEVVADMMAAFPARRRRSSLQARPA